MSPEIGCSAEGAAVEMPAALQQQGVDHCPPAKTRTVESLEGLAAPVVGHASTGVQACDIIPSQSLFVRRLRRQDQGDRHQHRQADQAAADPGALPGQAQPSPPGGDDKRPFEQMNRRRRQRMHDDEQGGDAKQQSQQGTEHGAFLDRLPPS